MKDIQIYNDRMRKSLMDKIFFIDKVDATVFIDFGCADGSMIKLLNSMFPEYYYVGYDNNPDMIRLADTNVNSTNTEFYSDWDKLCTNLALNYEGEKTCLILSSVLHEVEDKVEFFDFAGFQNFDYVAIRDMMYEESYSSKMLMNSIYQKLPENIIAHYGTNIWSGYNMIQGMFKSYYPENIETEINEDYFSFNQKHLYLLQYKYGLKPLYESHYLLPYWEETVKRDFGVDLTGIKTHIKIIYKTK